jgi:hypothetical protein
MRLTPFRLMLIPALLVLVMLLAAIVYLTQLRRQRVLQDAIGDIDNVLLEGRGEHWLVKWLSDDFSESLPATELKLDVDGPESMTACVPLCRELEGIDEIHISEGGELTDKQWQLILDQPKLKRLGVYATEPSDSHVQSLTNHQHLREINFLQAPIGDATLKAFASLPVLKKLILHETDISVEAVEAFYDAHPAVRIGYSPRAKRSQVESAKALWELKIYADFGHPQDRIAHELAWSIVIYSDVMLTPEAVAYLDRLGGSVAVVTVNNDLTPEALDFIYHKPAVPWVVLRGHRLSPADVDNLAILASIKKVDYDDSVFTAEQNAELRKRWGNKVPPPLPPAPGVPLPRAEVTSQ